VHKASTFLVMMGDVHPMTGINEVLYMVKTVSGRDYPVLNMPNWILLHRLRPDDCDPRRCKRTVKGPSYSVMQFALYADLSSLFQTADRCVSS
jgi:hypothetical protein